MIRDKLLTNNVLQMAHDIRSPLFALQVILQSGEFNEQKRNLLLQATERLKQIADSILEENKKTEKVALKNLIQEIIEEKKFSHPAFNFEFYSCENAVFKLQAIEMKRIISNLINNSIEAYDDKTGEIHISLTQTKGMVEITIRDYGKGIPLSLIPKIFSGSYGKKNGNGLGLSHAKSYIESIGGKINLTSSVLGTEVVITI
jgi:signal transduction histidine kinase